MHEIVKHPASAEERLAQLEAENARLTGEITLLKQLYIRAPFAYQSLDDAGCLLEVNEEWLDTLGFTKEEVIGKNFGEFLHPSWQQHFKENFPRFKAVGEILGVEFEMIAKNGSTVHVTFDGKVAKNLAGQFQQTHCVFQNITRQTQIEETRAALGESNARLRLTEEGGNIGLWELNIETDVLDFSPQLNRLYGLPPGSIKTYQDWRERIHPKDIQRVEGERNNALGKHETYEVEYRIYHASGEYRWISSKADPIYNTAGKAVRLVGVNIDITERKKAEEALLESEERFRTMINTIPQLAFMARPDGYLFWYNNRWYDYTGTTPEQMEGWGWQSVHDPEVLPRVMDSWQAAITAADPFEMTFPLRGAEGVFRLFLTRIIPLKDSDGKVERWVGTCTDISDIKRLEAELQASEALYRGIGEAIEYGVWTCTADGRYTYASDSFLRLVGISHEECLNTGWANILHPDDLKVTIAQWQKCVKAGGKWSREHRLRGIDNKWHHILARGVPIKNEQGQVTGWAGIHLDITDLKQAMEQVQTSLAEKEVMLREIHHRVKNNLQVISSLVSLQVDNVTDERVKAELNDMRHRIHSMALVHDKLYQTGDLAQLNFADYISSLLHYLWRSHSTATDTVQLHQSLSAVPMTIEVAVPCGLILNELVVNSLKHAFKDGRAGEVWVGLAQDPEAGTISLSVKDNGVGLLKEFDWTRSSTLGLRLVQILSRQIGGTIKKGDGPGTEYTIIFSEKAEGRAP